MRKPNLGTRDPITRFNGKNESYDDLIWDTLLFNPSYDVSVLTCNMGEVEFKKTLNKNL